MVRATARKGSFGARWLLASSSNSRACSLRSCLSAGLSAWRIISMALSARSSAALTRFSLSCRCSTRSRRSNPYTSMETCPFGLGTRLASIWIVLGRTRPLARNSRCCSGSSTQGLSSSSTSFFCAAWSRQRNISLTTGNRLALPDMPVLSSAKVLPRLRLQSMHDGSRLSQSAASQ